MDAGIQGVMADHDMAVGGWSVSDGNTIEIFAFTLLWLRNHG